MTMRRIVVASCTVALVAGMSAPAHADSILESAERFAREAAVQSSDVGGRSVAKTTLTAVLGIAGTALLLVDREQPQQPTLVSEEQVWTRWAELATGEFAGSPRRHPDPAIDVSLLLNYLEGVSIGISVGTEAAMNAVFENGQRVYNGEIQPFKERSAGMKYGGAALVGASVLVAVLWPDGPRMSAAPTVGGAQFQTSFGF